MSSDVPNIVLLIDDNPSNLHVAVAQLESYDIEVRTARDGLSGIKRARNTRIGLILLDIEMPGIDGYETCRRLKADPELAAIPVIFMTSRSSLEDKNQAYEAGGIDYVTKPFEALELMARVQTQLELRALQHRSAAQILERERLQLARASLERAQALLAEGETSEPSLPHLERARTLLDPSVDPLLDPLPGDVDPPDVEA